MDKILLEIYLHNVDSLEGNNANYAQYLSR
eukprot:Gb_22101 [translate_table: standard]